MSITKIKANRWAVRWTESGTRHSRTFATRTEARAFEARLGAMLCARPSCTNPVPAPAGPGRPAKFCSTACKQADYRDRRDREGIDTEAARRDVLDTLDNWAGRLMLDTPAERRAFLELVAMDVANELATLA